MFRLCPQCNIRRPEVSFGRLRYCLECRRETLRPDELRPVPADFANKLAGVIEQIWEMRALEQARIKRWFDGRD